MVQDREGRLTWLLRFQTHSKACRETEGTSGPTSPPGGSSALPPPQAPTRLTWEELWPVPQRRVSWEEEWT